MLKWLRCQPIFERFSELLIKYREPIINSFVMVEKIGRNGKYKSRLSNGPVESINRKIKDLKRNARGFQNFEHFRNRFFYATRSEPVLNGVKDLTLKLNPQQLMQFRYQTLRINPQTDW